MLYLQRASGNRAVARMVRASRVIGRQPTRRIGGASDPASKTTAARTPAKLAELARFPGDAHHAWKNLSAADRESVLNTMARRYGREFANRFHDVAEHGTPDFTVTYWQPGLGKTAEQLTAGGWRRAGMEITGNASIDVEDWVYPSGKMIRRDVSPGSWTKSPDAPEEPPEDPCGEEFGELKRRLWPAMAAFEADVEQLEASPQAPDRASTKARMERERKALRKLVTQLSNLADDTDSDDLCADAFGDEATDALEQYTRILARFNGIH